MFTSDRSTTDLVQTRLTTRLYSILTNAVIGSLFAFFAYSAFRNWWETGHLQMLILALQEAMIVWLVIIRNPAYHESRSVWDWLVAFVGTAAPMLQRPTETVSSFVNVGIAFQFVGTVLATIAIFNLGRSFGIVAAIRRVRTEGFYRYVRHPIYGSYIVGYVGFLLGNLSIWNVVLLSLTVFCQYLRARAEERILLQDPAYQEYVRKVRYRFIPFLF
jgi:protein-S-isoprenylcysteine O-methyltransferase Ste14